MNPIKFYFAICLMLSAFSLSACQPESKAAPKGLNTPEVKVLEINNQNVDLYTEVPAQTFARHKVEVRGRVDGYIEKWFFKPGQQVRANQPLYELDSRPYKAQLEEANSNLEKAKADLTFAERQVSLLEAKANLTQAKAALLKARRDYDRFKVLVDQGAISRQDFDTASTNLTSAHAEVKAKEALVKQASVNTQTQIAGALAKVKAEEALVEKARLNVQYSTIKAPIAGLIGDSLLPVGGLVTANAEDPLTTIIPLDTVWVRFKVTEAQYLKYHTSMDHSNDTKLEMFLADGTKFPHYGKLANALNEVDRNTGTLEVHAQFPNPEKKILPGQFARIRYVGDHLSNVLLVPVQAIQQTQNISNVLVVGKTNEIEARPVRLGERRGNDVVIENGLNPGDKIVVDGLLGVRPGMKVNPVVTKLAAPDEENKSQQTALAG